MNLARVRQSPEHWKKAAVERRKKAEAQARHIARLQKKLADRDEALAQLRTRVAELTLSADDRALVVVPLGFKAPQVRVVCVMLFLVGVVPCNAVERILGFLAGSRRVSCD